MEWYDRERRERIIVIEWLQQRTSRLSRGWQQAEKGISHLLEDSPTKKNISTLDGVRAMACLAVVTYHISYSLGLAKIHSLGYLLPSIILAGDTGVTLFFVLSGFLLFLPYAKSLLFETSWPSTRYFYLRRALRILPGYYVSLFLLILLIHPEYLHFDHLTQLTLFLTLFMDSSSTTYRQINGPFWTLAVEWQFYLLLPLFALAIRSIVQQGSLQRRAWLLSLCLATLAAWGVFSRWTGLYLTADPTRTSGFLAPIWQQLLFFFFGASGSGLHGKFLEDFAIGMGVCSCYVLASTLSPQGTFNRLLRRFSAWLWGIGILWLILLAVWKLQIRLSVPLLGTISTRLFPNYDIWSELFFSLGYGSVILAVLFGHQHIQRLFTWSPLRWIGHISYSLYIWHLSFVTLFLTVILPQLSGLWLPLIYGLCWLWVLLTAFPFSFLFFVGVERPWIRLSNSWLKRKGPPFVRQAQARSSY